MIRAHLLHFEPYIERVAGATRYDTAVETSLRLFPDGAKRVLLASGTNFPDALVGAPLLKAGLGLNVRHGDQPAPLLLTEKDRLPTAVKSEISRLGAESVMILGGELAISRAVEKELLASGLLVTRIAGCDRN